GRGVGRGVAVAVGLLKKPPTSGAAAGFGGASMPSSNGRAPRQAMAIAIQKRRRRRRPTSRAGAGGPSVGITASDIATGFLPHVYLMVDQHKPARALPASITTTLPG